MSEMLREDLSGCSCLDCLTDVDNYLIEWSSTPSTITTTIVMIVILLLNDVSTMSEHVSKQQRIIELNNQQQTEQRETCQ